MDSLPKITDTTSGGTRIWTQVFLTTKHVRNASVGSKARAREEQGFYFTFPSLCVVFLSTSLPEKKARNVQSPLFNPWARRVLNVAIDHLPAKHWSILQLEIFLLSWNCCWRSVQPSFHTEALTWNHSQAALGAMVRDCWGLSVQFEHDLSRIWWQIICRRQEWLRALALKVGCFRESQLFCFMLVWPWTRICCFSKSWFLYP